MIRALTPQGQRFAMSWLRSGLTSLPLPDQGRLAPLPDQGRFAPLRLAPEHTVVVSNRDWDQPATDGLLARITRIEPGVPTLDMDIAPVLHQALPLGRHLAQDHRVWGWLAMDPLWHLLQHRWQRANPDRVLGRPVQHGLARLWWAAELTKGDGEDPYVDTKRFVKWQYPLDRLLGSQFARTRHVLLGIVDAVSGLHSQLVSDTVKRLGLIASTVCLEALTREEVAELVQGIVEAVRFEP